MRRLSLCSLVFTLGCFIAPRETDVGVAKLTVERAKPPLVHWLIDNSGSMLLPIDANDSHCTPGCANGTVCPADCITRKAIREQDQDSRLLQALREHDCYSWKPRGPLYMVGLVQDGVVPFDNTRKAVRTMRSLGVRTDTMQYSAITTREMDHGDAAAPSLALARRFFDGGFKAVPADPDPD